jgi:DtxR family Mn-dependent transcriptional regulator
MSVVVLLMWAAVVILAGMIVLWPKRGLLSRAADTRRAAQRERLEDALKIIHSHAYEGRPVTGETLASDLRLGRAAASRLTEELREQGLVQARADGLQLTPEGERWALQIVRAHRLWERYLAGEARLPLEQVHREAHRREHTLTPTEVDDLEIRLGYPDRDPHGDLIPSRGGEMPQRPATSLEEWPIQAPGVIVHLEDEPPIAYAQLLAEGLDLGQTVRVLEKTSDRVAISNGEREVRLAPAVARNIYLAPAPAAPSALAGVVALSQLPDRAEAEVVTIDDRLQGYTRRRLLDLGLTPGARLVAEMRNFAGDPRAYRIRGTLIALRREQADDIWVRPTRAPTESAAGKKEVVNDIPM